MLVRGIKTHIIQQSDNLLSLLDQYIPRLNENAILVITSKIISILENQILPKEGIEKKLLIQKEADFFLETEENSFDFYLTIKNGILIPSSGIDESNSNNTYILYPKNLEDTVLKIWNYIKTRDRIQKLGILVTDSHSTLMRRGLTGIALSWIGFKPINSYVGAPDIYQESLKITQVNVIDSLATAAVFIMGEGNEQIPFVVIENAPHIAYVDHQPSEEEKKQVYFSVEEDLYISLLQKGKWKKTIK